MVNIEMYERIFLTFQVTSFCLFVVHVNVEINAYKLRDFSVYASYTVGEEKTTQSEFSFKLYFLHGVHFYFLTTQHL